MIARNLSKRATTLLRTAQRAQSTSTMGALANHGTQHYENSASIPDKELNRKGFSTALLSQGIEEVCFPTLMAASHDTTQVPSAFGAEIDLTHATLAVISQEHDFDQILLILTHGEATYGDDDDDAAGSNILSLTAQGKGQALSISGQTATFCSNDTGLIPQLFVVPPLQCATESALISFPYDSPDSIHETKWICHGAAITQCQGEGQDEVSSTTPLGHLESAFPGIDYNLANERSDLLSWLATRDEKIIAVASTPSWVKSFCKNFGPEKSSKNLRAVGIKYI